MKTMISALATTAVAALAAGSAHAHASFANAPVQPESYVAAVLQVPHGCEGKATNEVQIKLPEGFVFAKPILLFLKGKGYVPVYRLRNPRILAVPRRRHTPKAA